MLPKKIAFVDVETTGARPQCDRIIELGIVRFEEGTVTQTFSQLFNPGLYLSPFIENLTGISAKELEDAPTFYQYKDEIQEILEDCVFVAHNVRFDYSFVKNEFKRLGVSFSPKHFCTVKLSRALYPEYPRHNLDSLIERFGFTCEARHRAFGDADVLRQFYEYIVREVPHDTIQKAIEFGLKKPSVPINISQDIIDNLPETPGVYIFYAQENEEKTSQTESTDAVNDASQIQYKTSASIQNHVPLYIGKSVNLRDRILSHFSSDHLSSTEMNISQQIGHIETRQTSGELGALFLESKLIKEMQPIYNKRLRMKRELIILRQIKRDDGFYTAALETVKNIFVDELDQIIGIFRSRKQAKDFLLDMAKRHNLCQKLLNLENTKSACFGSHLGWCPGACKGIEKPIFYNIRFIEAFSKHKLKAWPFSGPILIEEKDELNETHEVFLVDKWCFLGGYTTEIEDLSAAEYLFDLDAYKILVNFIFDPKNERKIKTIKRTPAQEYLV